MEYCHTQKAPLHWLLHAVAAAMIISAWFARSNPVLAWILVITACLTVVFAFSFRYLTVSDQHDSLSIRYGPLLLFGKRIPYANITAVEAGRSSLIDGWGIHYVPSRGMTYNLWGYSCAVLRLGKKTVRIGTDDVENLVVFLKEKIDQLN